jgi:hypothetical protein
MAAPLIARLQSPLAFPGGNPGYDPSHIASGPGVRISAVAVSGSPLCVNSGAQPTIVNGPYPSKILSIGPCLYYTNAAANYASFPIPIETPGAITYATILVPNASNANGAVLLTNNGTASGAAATDFYLQSLVPTINVNNVAVSSSIMLTIGTPYFLAVSVISGKPANFVVMNLATGKVQSATVANANNIQANGSGTLVIGDILVNLLYQAVSYIGPVMFSVSALSMPQLLQWAAAPWDFWYPQTLPRTMFQGLSNSRGIIIGLGSIPPGMSM